MPPRHDLIRLRQSVAENALSLARELEAGRASTPFEEKLSSLLPDEPPTPVRAAVIALNAEAGQALLSEIIGQDYNVCKVVVPSRLGFSEVLLQERGFLLDSGAGAREFEDAGSFVEELQKTHALPAGDEVTLEPLRLKLKGPAHLNGLCLLVPAGLDAIRSRPALLSTLADQADWVFLVGRPDLSVDAATRAPVQLLLDQVTGVQHVQVPAENAPTAPAGEEWWRGWRTELSLGLVRNGTDLLRSRLALLTAPDSELRHYLVECRLGHQLTATLMLMDEELRQTQRVTANRANLAKSGLLPDATNTDLRKASETVRAGLAEESESLLRACERDTKALLATGGDIFLKLQSAAAALTIEDIERAPAETVEKLTLGEHISRRFADLLASIARERLACDAQALREGLECSVRDAESTLEKATGMRHKLNLELPDETALTALLGQGARPEIKYKGEMPRATLGTRLSTARQGIMGLMIAGTILGGAASLTGDQGAGQALRTGLMALMLPLMIVAFLWTYVSFRKKEKLLLEKEVDKLMEGVLAELRRTQHELLREQHSALAAATQKALRSLQQQADAALERVQQLRQREAEDQRRRQGEQQRTLDQKLNRTAEQIRQLAALRSRLDESQKIRRQWLADWIARFNKG